MIEIHSLTQGHKYWDEVILLAEKCSWKAGTLLAGKMKNNDFAEWERVFAARVDKRVVGFCTLTEKDELPQKYGFTPFVGFVFVVEAYRGNRLSEAMIKSAVSYAYELGYKEIYIMSGEVGLYEKYGFKKLGDYETIYGSVDQLLVKSTLNG